MEIVKKANALADGCSELMLSSVSENGYPRTCVMSKIKNEGIGKVWFSTGLNGTKVRHFKENPKASACFWKDADSVTLMGTVEIKTDRQTREDMWQDWFINHFPGGIDDPTYCVLVFTAEEATFWIDHEFVTVGQEAF